MALIALPTSHPSSQRRIRCRAVYRPNRRRVICGEPLVSRTLRYYTHVSRNRELPRQTPPRTHRRCLSSSPRIVGREDRCCGLLKVCCCGWYARLEVLTPCPAIRPKADRHCLRRCRNCRARQGPEVLRSPCPAIRPKADALPSPWTVGQARTERPQGDSHPRPPLSQPTGSATPPSRLLLGR